jgi:hypothetical protein
VIDIEILWRQKTTARAAHQMISIYNLGDKLGQVALHFLPKLFLQRRRVNVRHGSCSLSMAASEGEAHNALRIPIVADIRANST